MDKIVSYDQYRELIQVARNRDFQLSNCFFLPAEIKQKIADGTLYSCFRDEGLILLDSKNTFYRCYYYLLEDGASEPLELDKDAVIELLFQGGMSGKELMQIEKIGQMGFRLGRESAVMSLSAEKTAEYYVNRENCVFAVERDIIGIFDLLYSHFNPLYAYLPAEDELRGKIEDGKVFVVRDGKRLAGVLVSDFRKKTASISQIAVDPAFRRQGIASELLCSYHKHYLSEASVFQHWVDVKNTAAVNMYQKHGYEFTSRRANEYIRLIKEVALS